MLMHRELPNSLAPRQASSNLTRGECPNGGQWYSCGAQSDGFVGCCTSNPCTSVGCTAGNIRAASLGNIDYNTTPDQACLAGGAFYTCAGPPSFWGCCKSNPCANPAGVQCPQLDVAPVSLIQNADNPFKSAPAATTSAAAGGSGGSSTPTGAIVGGVVGGVLGLALIGVLFFWVRRKRQASEKEPPTAPMAFNPHSQQADPGSNVPLTYPEVVDHYATSPQPTKQNFPPSAFTSPALPQYSDRRMSHELGGGHENTAYISPMSSPGFAGQHARPMSYELHGTGSPGMPPKAGGMHTPSIMSTAVSELPAEDFRYSQMSSSMQYSGQPPSSPPPPPPNNEGSGAGLGLSMPGQQSENR